MTKKLRLHNSKQLIYNQIKRRIKYLRSHPFRISQLSFEKNFLYVSLSNRSKKKQAYLNASLVVKNMEEEELEYQVPLVHLLNEQYDHEMHACINLEKFPSLLEHGKWAFYVRNEEKDYRLLPSKSFRRDIYSFANKMVDGNRIIEPYITVKGNVSLAAKDTVLDNQIHRIPNYVDNVTTFQSSLVLEGWANFHSLDKQYIQLLIQKRDSTFHYYSPITWLSDDRWKATVSFSENDYPKGIWDYYFLLDSGQKFRIKVQDKQTLTNTDPLFYQTDKESRELKTYITKKGSLSSKSKMAFIKVRNLESEAVDNWNTKLKGSLRSYILKSHNPDVPIKMVLRQRNTEQFYEFPIKVAPDPMSEGYLFEFPFNYRDVIPFSNLENIRWDAYLQLHIYGEDHRFRLRVKSKNVAYQSRIQFRTSTIYQAFYYSTVKNHLSLSLTQLTIQRDLERFKFKDNKLLLKGYAYLDTISFKDPDAIQRYLLVRARETEEELKIPLAPKLRNKLSKGMYNYRYAGFETEVSLREVYSQLKTVDKEIYDLFIQIEYDGITRERKLGSQHYTYFKDEILKKQTVSYDGYHIRNYLTYTPRGNLKIEAISFSEAKLKYLKYGQFIDRLLNKQREIWLVGERPDTAQDTGYHFFKYCRTHYPDKEVYYVINRDSADRRNIEKFGNVLYNGSSAHLRMTALASAFIGSHDPDYFLPTKGAELYSFKKGKRVFLQHGVLGRKNVEYHRRFYKYPFHMFCVSSEPEKKLVETKMGYRQKEVKVTGLSRFDNLLKDHQEERSILIIPTWREWLKTEDDFLESEYFRRYNSLLNSKRLSELLEKYEVHINLYPHYRMQQFIDHFGGLSCERINVIKLGEKNVQEMLMENKLMITDYSSVSFDFSYMSKPVAFYHFDSDSFFRDGILRPIEETFLGNICRTEDQLLETIEHYLLENFQEDQSVAEKKHLIFSQIDQNNCKRIYENITHL
ncbi:CDP-glycerol glycerophosphotransferase family protein [Sediminibacillus albus]|uniref:CDP-glycerol glycerophosphotransferase, TagB/SpsB family n=1 Tax=Sediminibacillus albus TaxID=407036 RepID=A0A1G8ZGM1_9BACI|nr:CDP-glycerol glycerophosphotransferase family protein [Sediminibacillus albus]SDK14133.1 CDP-glycerol glycerophosphotransferase, TagB/SpsB family [Sediminibacillus albus]